MTRQALKLDNRLIPYQIEHKKTVTRRVHLRTAQDGSLLVIAPRRMSKRTIHNMLQERVHKVASFLVGAQVRLSETPQLSYVQGEKHLYLGESYPLKIRPVSGRGGSVELMNDVICINTPSDDPARIKKLLLSWYRSCSAEYFAARLDVLVKHAPWVDQALPPIRLRKMKRTWGSCSGKRVITLNTRLIKAPAECIDYVIAHELCHLKEMNHGKAFYTLQEALFPQWRTVRSRLRQQAHLYLID